MSKWPDELFGSFERILSACSFAFWLSLERS